MVVLANLCGALAYVLNILITVMFYIIIARAIISWVNPDPHNPFVQFLYKTTEPILYPIRKILPLNFRFGIDISPMIAILILLFLQKFLVPTLVHLSRSLQY